MTPTVVSMPRQSSSSLNAARKLKNAVTTKSASQYHSMAVVSAGLRGELQDFLARAHVAEILAGELFDVERIVAQLLDGDHQRLRAGVKASEIGFDQRELPLHRHDAQHAVCADRDADDDEDGEDQHYHLAWQRPIREVHRASRV